jgi:DNA-directed RNA polymerase subunit beta
MPWEGYNYEDAIVINERIIIEDCLTSIHLEECEINLTYSLKANEKLTKKLPHATKSISKKLNKAGIIKIGSYVKEHDILVGKITICEPEFPEEKLLRTLFKELGPTYRDTSLRVPHGTEGRVIDVRFLSTNLLTNEENTLSTSYETIRIYIAQIRKIQIGDKLAGRHGNKGIISKVLSRQDMPYLPDGTPIDIIFNPLGVPSRMNVGQVFECLLGLAGETLGKRYKVLPFDEIYGEEASRILTNQKLKEASCKEGFDWIFNAAYPGKILLRDGRTGEYFDNPITVGKSYILKLIHLVEDKIHARATGPYSMITEQPLAGKSQKGGQRFGEMEVWALEAYGSANTLQELLTIKSDDIDGRNDMYESILIRKNVKKPNPSLPEAFLALVRELNALGLEFSVRKFENGFSSTTDFLEVEKDFFQDLESKLKLRILLSRKKSEQLTRKSRFRKVEGLVSQQKLKKKRNKVVNKSNKLNPK